MKHNCKIKKKCEEEKNEIYERLLKLETYNRQLEEDNKKIIKDNKKFKQEIRKLKTNRLCIQNINNGINTNNGTIINNITLVGYGKEDFSKLDRIDIIRALKTGYNSSITLTEAVHFNPKYPEYHNVYISDIKDKYAMMFE